MCKAADNVCLMEESIIVWKDLTHICPFSLVKQVTLVFKGEGILYAEAERLAFQVTREEAFCGRKMLKTTSGLYMVMNTAKNDLPRLLIREMKNKTEKLDLEAAHGVARAELDGNVATLMDAVTRNSISICHNTEILMAAIKSMDGNHIVIKDVFDREKILFTHQGIVFLPDCTAITNFTLIDFENKRNCIAEFKISFKISNQTMRAKVSIALTNWKKEQK